MQPSDKGCASSMMPLAIAVVANGICQASIKRRKLAVFARRPALRPITATGRSAAASRLDAVSSSASPGGAINVPSEKSGTVSEVAANATSSGRSR
jgi:hypothetical protein